MLIKRRRGQHSDLHMTPNSKLLQVFGRQEFRGEVVLENDIIEWSTWGAAPEVLWVYLHIDSGIEVWGRFGIKCQERWRWHCYARNLQGARTNIPKQVATLSSRATCEHQWVTPFASKFDMILLVCSCIIGWKEFGQRTQSILRGRQIHLCFNCNTDY
jgi:hypothetical protein